MNIDLLHTEAKCIMVVLAQQFHPQDITIEPDAEFKITRCQNQMIKAVICILRRSLSIFLIKKLCLTAELFAILLIGRRNHSFYSLMNLGLAIITK